MAETLTPVLSVERSEPCLPLCLDGLGFEPVDSVPNGDVLGFTMSLRGQTGAARASD